MVMGAPANSSLAVEGKSIPSNKHPVHTSKGHHGEDKECVQIFRKVNFSLLAGISFSCTVAKI